jgi:hypothetical protein
MLAVLLAGVELTGVGVELAGAELTGVVLEAAGVEDFVCPPQAAKAVVARTPRIKLVILLLLIIKFTLLSKLVRARTQNEMV